MAAQATPVLDRFLSGIADIVRSRDGAKLQDFLQIEPPLSEIYQQMLVELRQQYPSGSRKEADLLRRCEGLVPRSKDSSSWIAFPTFMKLYFTFLRDVNVDNLLETYNLLKGLLKYVPTPSSSFFRTAADSFTFVTANACWLSGTASSA